MTKAKSSTLKKTTAKPKAKTAKKTPTPTLTQDTVGELDKTTADLDLESIKKMEADLQEYSDSQDPKKLEYGKPADTIDPSLMAPEMVKNFVNGTIADIKERIPLPPTQSLLSTDPQTPMDFHDVDDGIGNTLMFTGQPDYSSRVSDGMNASKTEVVTPELVKRMNDDTARISNEFNRNANYTHTCNVLFDLRKHTKLLNDLPSQFVKAVAGYVANGCSYVYEPGSKFTIKIGLSTRVTEISIAVGTNLSMNGESLTIESHNTNGAAFCINGTFNKDHLLALPNAQALYNHIAKLAVKTIS